MQIRLLFRLAIATLAMSSVALPAAAAELFQARSGTEQQPARTAADKTIKRQRYVDLDAKTLADAIIPPGLDTASDRAERARAQSGKVSIRLFEDVRIDFERIDVEDGFEAGIVWNGRSNLGDDAILVVRDNRVTGVVESKGRHFLIEYTGPGKQHRIKEIDTEAYPRDVHRTPPALPKKKQSLKIQKPGSSAATTATEVTLLVAYTSRAKNQLGSTFKDKIRLDVGRMNKALSNSGVAMKVRIVGFKPVWSGYNELASSNSSEPLNSITSGNSFNFADIRNYRNTVAADIVTVYTVRPDYCGLAWVNYPSPSATYSYSVINADCQGTLTLAHEIGHNMGLYHDRYVESPSSNSQYN
jgi:hypothetical protein